MFEDLWSVKSKNSRTKKWNNGNRQQDNEGTKQWMKMNDPRRYWDGNQIQREKEEDFPKIG